MSASDKTNNANTATTSPSARQTEADARPPKSETEYLAQQADDARKAMQAVLSDLKSCLAEGLNVGNLTGRHPILTLGAAAVGGLVGALALVPSKEQQALKKLAQMHAAITPPATADNARPASPSLGGKLLHELMGTIRPALMSALTSGFATKTDPQPDHNGHPA